MKTVPTLIIISLAAFATPAAAQERLDEAPPEVFSRMTACQDVRDNGERLACFDREVAAFVRAQMARQVVVVDRAQVERTRRSLFGLTLPEVGRLFGDDPESEINSTIMAVQFNNLGMASIQIDSGAVWVQTEGRALPRRPRAGMPVRIRRGALGAYLANIDGQRAVRVTRQR